jgi:hypothetical protein
MERTEQLLTRTQFREEVFSRDNHKCVICKEPAQDAHHILERRLWPDGGYYLSNGASLCGKHHIQAETTEISCEEIREAAGIAKVLLPPHLYGDTRYTKWADIILSENIRTPGELFQDESVQKILNQGGMLPLYINRVKYSRTYHLPWTGSIGKDDRITDNLNVFNNEIVMTEKLDGENTTMYQDGYLHTRSIDSDSHWTQSWVRNLCAKIAHELPEDWRMCGENLFAQHSIKYDNLKSYFYVFSIWDEKNRCISWDETVLWCRLLGLETVPVIYKGKWDQSPEKIHSLWDKIYDEEEHEGYTIRNAGAFHYSGFRHNLLKYVRRNHVRTSTHWKFERIEQNKLCLPTMKE